MSADTSYDCAVIGAGVAGLAAARKLAEAGKRVIVIEARERVGGRLLTVCPEGEATPVELGAEFVHGRPPELLSLLDEAGLAYYETAGEQMRYEGGVLRATGWQDSGFFSLLGELSASGEDLTFDEFLALRRPPEGVENAAPEGARSQLSETARRARQYVEGFNAADAARIGTRGLARQQASEDAIEGDRSARLSGGYAGLAGYLSARVEAAGGVLLLGSPVGAVEWQPGRITITLISGEAHTARSAIVTLPLGVLQAGAVQFTPEPGGVLDAAASLSMGAVQRIVLRFRTRFWAERAPGMRFLFAADELPPTWWTTSPHESSLLTGWLGGPRSLAFSSLTSEADYGPERLLNSGLRSLERIFSLPAAGLDSELLGWHTHDWQLDPYSRGAYSYAPKGASEASALLATPVEGTLFFAGEHTDTTGHPGTVHGALRSGLRAATQVLDQLSV